MAAYILRRLLMALIVLFLVTLFIFFTMRLLPGDPLVIYMAQQAQQLQEMPPEVLDKLRHEFGLDKPMIVQYAIWISDLFKGDFGTSVFYRQSVGMLMLERFPVTTYLAVLSIILSAMVGIISGLIAAIRRGRLIDNVVTGISINHYEVKWNHEEGQWGRYDHKKEKFELLSGLKQEYMTKWYTVIGNIYENPELLDEE